MNTQRLNNVSIYGAVSNCLDDTLVFQIHKATNREGWKEFLRELKDRVDRSYRSFKPYLIIDNHPVHHSYAVRDAYEGFHVLFLPPYSSFFNSQESVFSVMKAELHKHFARMQGEVLTQPARHD